MTLLSKTTSFFEGSVQPKSLWEALKQGPLKVFIIGGGNWGTVMARIAARNAAASYLFDSTVHMWLKEELVDGRPLTELINEKNENPKYLPSHSLPKNLVATPELQQHAEQADLIIIVLPHQFVIPVCKQLRGHVKPTSRALTLVKGLHNEQTANKTYVPKLFSTIIEEALEVPCFALSGANVAADIAKEQFSESTLGYDVRDTQSAAVWQQLLDRPYFKVNAIPDIAGVQVCGAVKNVIALAAGFCDGLGQGTNTKAAIIRIGVEEMKAFGNVFFKGILEESFFDSSGYPDVITTCFGGRNVKCAAEFVRRGGKSSWEELELEMLGGQKLQGQLTAKEVYEIIESNCLTSSFPLFNIVYQIAFQGAPPSRLIETFATNATRSLKDGSECSPCIVSREIKTMRKLAMNHHE